MKRNDDQFRQFHILIFSRLISIVVLHVENEEWRWRRNRGPVIDLIKREMPIRCSVAYMHARARAFEAHRLVRAYVKWTWCIHPCRTSSLLVASRNRWPLVYYCACIFFLSFNFHYIFVFVIFCSAHAHKCTPNVRTYCSNGSGWCRWPEVEEISTLSGVCTAEHLPMQTNPKQKSNRMNFILLHLSYRSIGSSQISGNSECIMCVCRLESRASCLCLRLCVCMCSHAGSLCCNTEMEHVSNTLDCNCWLIVRMRINKCWTRV